MLTVNGQLCEIPPQNLIELSCLWTRLLVWNSHSQESFHWQSRAPRLLRVIYEATPPNVPKRNFKFGNVQSVLESLKAGIGKWSTNPTPPDLNYKPGLWFDFCRKRCGEIYMVPSRTVIFFSAARTSESASGSTHFPLWELWTLLAHLFDLRAIHQRALTPAHALVGISHRTRFNLRTHVLHPYCSANGTRITTVTARMVLDTRPRPNV